MEAFIIDKDYNSALYSIIPYNETGTTDDYKVYLKDREIKS